MKNPIKKITEEIDKILEKYPDRNIKFNIATLRYENNSDYGECEISNLEIELTKVNDGKHSAENL